MLSYEQLQHIAPSVFTNEGHESTSDKYVPLSTIGVLKALEKQGFYPIRAQQQRTRIEGRKNFTKHRIILRQESTKLEVGDTVGEIQLVNSFDGSSALILEGGIFRCTCSNQATVPDGWVQSERIRHTVTTIDDAIEGVYRIVEDLPRVIDNAQSMRAIHLKEYQQHAFATAAWAIRNSDDPAPTKALLKPRRYVDTGDDLWSVYNRVQENMIKGGVPNGRTEQGRRKSTRRVTGIDEDRRINKALLILAENLQTQLR